MTGKAPKRPIVTLKLRPEPGVDLRMALRRLLKSILRKHGFKCIGVSEEKP